jgi:4-hydroxysphinganine ceramide fatty acyl 2-hydroxylase
MKKFNLISLLFQIPNPVMYDAAFYLIDIIAIGYGLYCGVSIWATLFTFIFGVFTWVLLEYIIHRYIFHHKSNNLTIRKIVYAIHGVHHAHSHDNDKMFVPFIPAVFMAAVLLYLLIGLVGNIGFALFAGIIFMHQVYNYIHIMIHTNTLPNNRLLQSLRQNHIKHHQGFGEKCFGVTSTFCDKIFRTL